MGWDGWQLIGRTGDGGGGPGGATKGGGRVPVMARGVLVTGGALRPHSERSLLAEGCPCDCDPIEEYLVRVVEATVALRSAGGQQVAV